MVGLLVLVGVAVIVVVGVVGFDRFERRRIAGRADAAAALGLTTWPMLPLPADADFPLFARRPSREVAEVIGEPGSNDLGFVYHHHLSSDGDGLRSNDGSEMFSCALVELPFDSPPSTIHRGGWMARLLGPGELGEPVGLPDELRDHRCTGDEEFLRRLLTDEVRAGLDRPDSPANCSFAGRWMLCCDKGRSIDDRVELLASARALRDLLPTDLRDRYPRG